MVRLRDAATSDLFQLVRQRVRHEEAGQQLRLERQCPKSEADRHIVFRSVDDDDGVATAHRSLTDAGAGDIEPFSGEVLTEHSIAEISR